MSSNRYHISGSEGQYQPNSDGKVLLNLQGITDPVEMNIQETDLLAELYIKVFAEFPESLTMATLQSWHQQWLSSLYDWAGHYRSVDMSKPNIRFASPLLIPKLATKFEESYLSRFSQLPEMNDEQLVSFLAELHVEFILLHPFREGNGRISRLLLDVMAVQAGAETLDYSLWEKHKDFYFAAIQAGVNEDYQHIERLIRDVLER